MNWMDVGEPPAGVAEWQAARMKKMGPIFSTASGLLIGAMAGFAALLIWRGSFSWSLPGKLELFFAVALPVGVIEFLVNGRVVAWIAKATRLHIRRVALFDGKLYMEPVQGATFDRPLSRVQVSKTALAAGWYLVSLPAGRTVLTFWVPPEVATTVRAAQGD